MNIDVPANYGRLELICGPMFAGKTSELMRSVRRYRLCSFNCLVVKYEADSRYSQDDIVTHDDSRMTAVKTGTLFNKHIISGMYHVIAIDEGQFFPDIVDFCTEQLKNGKILIVAGLDGTFLRTGFENILNLVPLASSMKKLSAVCMSCGGNASFTKRTTSEEKIQVIGGIDMYMAVCRLCYKIPSPVKRTPFKSERPLNFSNISKIYSEPTCKRQILL